MSTSVLRGKTVPLPKQTQLHRYFEEQLETVMDQQMDKQVNQQTNRQLCPDRRNTYKLNKYQMINKSQLEQINDSIADEQTDVGESSVV